MPPSVVTFLFTHLPRVKSFETMTLRNDPCPCGSGKKYKKCCQHTEDQLDREYRRQQKVEADLVPVLFEVANNVLEPGAIDDAWIEFNGNDEVEPFEDDDPLAQVFLPWFFYYWAFDPNEYLRDYDNFDGPLENGDSDDEEEDGLLTIGLMHLVVLDDKLAEDQREFLTAANFATYTICEVLEVKSGSGMKLRDLFCNREFDVTERSASRSLQRGELIYCAPMKIREIVSLLALAPFALRPTHKISVLGLRKAMLAQSDQQALGDDQLAEFELEIRYLYLDLIDSASAPPQLFDRDGNQFLPATVHFEIDSSDEAFQKLKDLAGEDLQEELLTKATVKRKRIVEAKIPWVGLTDYGRIRLDGILNIHDHELKIEVYSQERADEITNIVEERLGAHARRSFTDFAPVDDEESWEHKGIESVGGKLKKKGESSISSAASGFDPHSPELQSVVRQVANEHWSRWYDVPVPALNDLTPREAALTEEGRDLLESLLLEYQIKIDQDPTNQSAPDIAAMRRELGLD
jgi:hypothetical protein